MPSVRIAAILLASALATMTGSRAHAWAAPAHETVGTIADRLITGTNAQSQVRAILGDMTLARASTWADCVKTLNVRGATCGVFATHGGKSEMQDFVARNSLCLRSYGAQACTKEYHYTDVNLAQSRYRSGLVGTRSDDIVAAIDAAVHYLRAHPPAAPFSFRDRHEALLALVHYVGDVHQPLHVGTVYLDSNGERVDPDRVGFRLTTSTAGGNLLFVSAKQDLHAKWDNIPATLRQSRVNSLWMLQAQAVPRTAGDVYSWPASWATDSLTQARVAFEGVSFSAKTGKRWQTSLPRNYTARINALKQTQLTAAGAHLAQLLRAIWP